ncbi:hypothetical protein [Nocardia sp. NPDC051570]
MEVDLVAGYLAYATTSEFGAAGAADTPIPGVSPVSVTPTIRTLPVQC